MDYPDKFKDKAALLCHDWLTGMRGGEKVLEILCNWFPSADICSLICNPESISESIKRHRIHTSRLQRFPGVFNNYRHLLPFFPSAARSINMPAADLMISTSHCVAKGFPKPSGARHLCYCFTPMRYAWLFQNEYLGRNPIKRILAAPVLAAMRKWDANANSNVDLFVAISNHVRDRIRDFYGRDAEVVYPPVDTETLTPIENGSSSFDLIVSALVPYKRVDLAVETYRSLGTPLKIAGIGSGLAALKAKASPNVEFLEWQSDSQILDLYRNCRMLVFPGEEDFGLVPVEAQACGKPVVAFAKGGALETVAEGESGVFFREQSPESLADAIRSCAARKWDSKAIRSNAERFSTRRFVEGLTDCIEKVLS